MAAKAKKADKTEAAETVIHAIKGFDKNLKCRDFQFEVGKTYEQPGKVVVCQNGFHAVTGSPFDVWNHYPVVADDGSLNRWAEVTLAGETQAKSERNDSKIAAAKITIDVELNLPAFVKKAVAWVIDATKGKGDNPSGDYAQIGSSGNSAQIGSSGYSAKIGSSGYYAQIGSSGNSAKIGSSGYYAQIGSSGYYAQIGSSGDYAKIGSSGDSAKIVAEGKDAVVASAGPGTSVQGIDGTWISIAEFDDSSPRKCIGFATGCIGKDGLEAGVAYTARGGKLVRA